MDPDGHSAGCYSRRRIRGRRRNWSLHACGRAIDWVPSSFSVGQWLNHVIVNSGSLDVQLVIWNRQQTFLTPEPHTSPYGGTNPHTDHLHIESRNAEPA